MRQEHANRKTVLPPNAGLRCGSITHDSRNPAPMPWVSSSAPPSLGRTPAASGRGGWPTLEGAATHGGFVIR